MAQIKARDLIVGHSYIFVNYRNEKMVMGTLLDKGPFSNREDPSAVFQFNNNGHIVSNTYAWDDKFMEQSSGGKRKSRRDRNRSRNRSRKSRKKHKSHR